MDVEEVGLMMHYIMFKLMASIKILTIHIKVETVFVGQMIGNFFGT